MSRKVAPGQVWECIDNGDQVRIDHLDDMQVFVEYTKLGKGGVPPKGLVAFGYVRDDGMPNSGWHRWFYLKEYPDWHALSHHLTVTKPREKQGAQSELDFFRTPTTPGNCVCNIPRSQCDYHR